MFHQIARRAMPRRFPVDTWARTILTPVVLAVPPAACSQQQPDYIPMAFGSVWEYAAEVRVGTDTLRGRTIFRIEDEPETINDKTYYRALETATGFAGVEPVVRFARKAQDGIYEIDGEHRDQPEYLILPLPITLGDTWTVTTPLGDSLVCQAEAVEAVWLADQEYEGCLKISCEGTRVMAGNEVAAKVIEYRAPGVGLVKAVTEAMGVVIELRLEKYEQ